MNVCRRTAGSGTNAQFAVHFLRTNCINNSTAMVTVDNNPLPFLQVPAVYENAGSSDMDDCLDALGDGAGFNGDFTDGLTAFPGDPTSGDGDSSVVPAGRDAFGIGYNSLERNTSLGRNYRFVKVDFAAPTLEETFNGIYDDIYYLSYQNRVSTGTTPDPRTGAIRTVPADASRDCCPGGVLPDLEQPDPGGGPGGQRRPDREPGWYRQQWRRVAGRFPRPDLGCAAGVLGRPARHRSAHPVGPRDHRRHGGQLPGTVDLQQHAVS